MKTLAVLVAVLFVPVTCLAQQASVTTTLYTTTWQGLTRECNLLIPSTLPLTGGEMVVTFHGNKYQMQPDITDYYGWDYRAKQPDGKFIVAACSSTHDPDSTSHQDKTGYLVWNAQYFDGMVFSTPPWGGTNWPDDSGFIRKMVGDVVARYNLNPKKIYAEGFSTGAFMAMRAAVDLSDVFAAISVASGALYATRETRRPGPLAAPISLIEYHGTADNNGIGVDPCVRTWPWNRFMVAKATIDDGFNYFVTQNSCTTKTNVPLCQINPDGTRTFTNNDTVSCANGVEVKVVWEIGAVHQHISANNPATLAFFRAHPKP